MIAITASTYNIVTENLKPDLGPEWSFLPNPSLHSAFNCKGFAQAPRLRVDTKDLNLLKGWRWGKPMTQSYSNLLLSYLLSLYPQSRKWRVNGYIYKYYANLPLQMYMNENNNINVEDVDLLPDPSIETIMSTYKILNQRLRYLVSPYVVRGHTFWIHTDYKD